MFGFCGDGAVVENLGLLNVDITSMASIGGSDVGGLIGMTGASDTRTSVSSCYVTGAVYGSTFVGGLVGFNYGTSIITNSHSSADVVASYDGNYAGGLVGENRGTTITGCYATGDVTGTGRVSGGEYGKEIGGLVGRNNDGTITDCYASGAVTGYNKVGGLVGVSTGSSNEITNSYAVGAVSGVFYEGVGGFVGQLGYTSVIRNCYSRGDVTRREDTNGRFGAFCGYTDGGLIEYSYSTSSVFSSEGNAWGDGDGLAANVGFIGDGSGTFTANFFDSDVSNQSSATGATAKTTSEMKTQSTFTDAGWDFEIETTNGTNDYWDIDGSETINDGYPYLSWQDGEDVSLPVELSSFTVEYRSGGVLLEWTTESETENLGFIIQKRILDTGNWILVSDYTDNSDLEGHGSTTQRHDYGYTDTQVQPGATYAYRLGDVDFSGSVVWHDPVEITVPVEDAAIPVEFGLQRPYPNPFNSQVTLQYVLDRDSKVNIQICDLRGWLVNSLVDADKIKGNHDITWQPEGLSTGIYIIRFESDKRTNFEKVLYIK